MGDGVDQDCDGGELCFPDEDGDGRGEPGSVWSDDMDCAGPGEAPADDDVCPGADDAIDPDGDGVPSGCDPCPTVPGPDCDGTGATTTTTTTPASGGDGDADGVVDAVDPVPDDAGGVSGTPPPPSIGCGCGWGRGPWGAWASLAALGALWRRRARIPR